MALGKNSAAIQELAGGEVHVSETDASGSSYGSWTELPYISGSSFTDATGVNNVADEAGDTFPVNSTREVTLEVTTMQKDKDTLKWATHTARDKYYGVLRKVNKAAVDGNHIWHFLPICKVDPESGYSTPGTDGAVFRFRCLVNASAISGVDGSSVDSNLSSMAVAANDYYDYILSAT